MRQSIMSVTEPRRVQFRPTNSWALLKSSAQYRVVGVREDGERVIISTSDSREMAEKALSLIKLRSPFKELLIEDGSGPQRGRRRPSE